MVTFSIKLFCLQTSTYVSSHFPEYWNKPEEYNPYRFEDEELLKRCVQTADILLQNFKALILSDTSLSALNSELTQIELTLFLFAFMLFLGEGNWEQKQVEFICELVKEFVVLW